MQTKTEIKKDSNFKIRYSGIQFLYIRSPASLKPLSEQRRRKRKLFFPTHSKLVSARHSEPNSSFQIKANQILSPTDVIVAGHSAWVGVKQLEFHPTYEDYQWWREVTLILVLKNPRPPELNSPIKLSITMIRNQMFPDKGTNKDVKPACSLQRNQWMVITNLKINSVSLSWKI